MPKLLKQAAKSVSSLYARSQLGAFFSWWKGELLGCLPQSMRERFTALPAKIVLSQHADQSWHAARVRGAKLEAERALDLADPANVRRALNYLESMNDQAAETKVLLLGSHQVLRKRLTLPLAAEENLAQVLSFEMDRQTPYKAEHVYFDWRVVKRDTAQRQLLVELLATPKVTLDAALAALTPAQVEVDAADAYVGRALSLDAHSSFNLMPEARRSASGDPQARMRWILAAALLGFVALAMKQSLDARQASLDALQAHTLSVQQRAMETAKLAKKLREEIDGANFLAVRKEKRAETTKVLLELTQIIPDNTFLERISFVGDAVQIQGQSTSADKLIALLQKAKLVNDPQFQGVIQPDPGTGKERFSMQISIKEDAVLAPAANAEQKPQPAPPPTPAAKTAAL
jgi:general secretion pathway protein L